MGLKSFLKITTESDDVLTPFNLTTIFFITESYFIAARSDVSEFVRLCILSFSVIQTPIQPKNVVGPFEI